MATANVFLFLTAYLILASSIIAIISEEASPITIGTIEVPIETQTNFTLISNITDLNAVIAHGSWNISQEKGLYSTSPFRNTIYFNTEEEDGIYNNTYYIVNPESRDHTIYIYSQIGFNTIAIYVDSEGFTLQKGLSQKGFYAYPFANSISHYNITTSWDTEKEWLTVTLDDTDTQIFSLPISKSFYSGIFSVLGHTEYYAGVEAVGENFQVRSLSSLFAPVYDEKSFVSLGEFLSTIAKIIFWNVSPELLPLWLNIFLIKVPVFTLIFILIQLIRGTG